MRHIRFDNLRAGRRHPGPSNPLARLLGLVAGFVLFILAVLLGGIVLAAIIGFFLIIGTIVYIRLWWLARKAARRGKEEFVEAEYRVIEVSEIEEDRS